MTLIAGIDEAGRGPVIGPLVICGVLIREKNIKKLEELNVKDSKLVTPRRRKELAPKIGDIAESIKVIKLSPKEIDESLESDNSNLNWLEASHSAIILNLLNPNRAFIDCPSPNIQAYKNFIRSKLKNKNIDLVVEHKADFKYLIVAAASIIAKVKRDEEIEKIKKEIGIDFGSGYPADPITVKFLKENYKKFSHIFRKTWEPYKKLARNKKLNEWFKE